MDQQQPTSILEEIHAWPARPTGKSASWTAWASPAAEPLPHQPLSSAEQIAASRLGYHQIAAWLAGEPEPVLHLSQRPWAVAKANERKHADPYQAANVRGDSIFTWASDLGAVPEGKQRNVFPSIEKKETLTND